MKFKKTLLVAAALIMAGFISYNFFGFYIIRYAANLGNKYAQNDIGAVYARGNVVEKNEDLAIHWYTKAAEQGLATAQSNLGILLYSRKDYAASIKWLELSALQGNTTAQLHLGYIYQTKRNLTPEDIAKSIHWYTVAAKNGDAEAQYRLGKIYWDGKITRANMQMAVKLISDSAYNDWPEAQAILGYFYYKGEGVEHNENMAKEWWKKGAKNGSADSQKYLNIVLEK